MKKQFCRGLDKKGAGVPILTLLVVFALRAPLAASDIYAFRGDGGVLYYTNVSAPGRQKVRLPLRVKGGSAPAAFPAAAFDPVIAAAGERFSVDPQLIRAIIQTESNFDPRAVSPKGALGLMQLMPGTAREMGVADPFDPEENIHGGVKYLRLLLDALHGDIPLALAAYNAGPGRVSRHKGVPPIPETRNYVNLVLGKLGLEGRLSR